MDPCGHICGLAGCASVVIRSVMSCSIRSPVRTARSVMMGTMLWADFSSEFTGPGREISVSLCTDPHCTSGLFRLDIIVRLVFSLEPCCSGIARQSASRWLPLPNSRPLGGRAPPLPSSACQR